MANNVQSVTMTLDGNTYNLTSLDGITWTAQFQAPAGSSYNLTNGKYNATITAAYETGGTTTVSGSGSDALSQKARLAVYEQIKPTANVTTPTANAYYTNSTQTLDFTIVDNGTQASGYSGVKLSTLAVTLSSVSLSESRSYGSSDFTSAAVIPYIWFICVLNLKYFKLTKVTTDRRARKPQRPYLVGRIDKD